MRKILRMISFIGAAISIGMGFYKLFAYSNPESSYLDVINAYVGGDAYNYIINANYATAYFVLAGVLVLIGSVCLYFEIQEEMFKKMTGMAFSSYGSKDDSYEDDMDKYGPSTDPKDFGFEPEEDCSKEEIEEYKEELEEELEK